jgi:ligand-binding sensor domain-containing protein
LSGDHVQALYIDRSGALWIGTWSGLAKLESLSEDGHAARFTRFQHDPKNPNSLSRNVIWSMHEDSRDRGKLWISTFGGGINRFDIATGQFKTYRHRTGEPFSLSYDVVRPICEDREGTLWFGTGDGLNRYDREHDQFLHYKYEPSNQRSLSNNDVWSLYEDRAGALWVGTYGGGLSEPAAKAETGTKADQLPAVLSLDRPHRCVECCRCRRGDELAAFHGCVAHDQSP